MSDTSAKTTPPRKPKNVGDFDFKVLRQAAPLRQSVTESIRTSIAVGMYKAGDRLTERDLCEMTGVSRTAVREALRQLESEGLIVVLPNRGPVVARLTPEQADGIYQVRMELEGLACELYASRATEQDHIALREALEELKRQSVNPDPVERLNAKNRFYDCLYAGTGNEALGLTAAMLNSRIMVLRATSLQSPGRTERSLAELTELVDLLIARRSPEARRASANHIANAAKIAINELKEQIKREEAESN